MNERIDDLYKQARLEAGYANGFDATVKDVYQKFADVIVQEAIGVLQKRFMGDLNREDLEVRRCIDDVKKHFGVIL